MNPAQKKKVKWGIVILCCLIFILCIEHVLNEFTVSFDQAIYQFVHQWSTPTMTMLFKIITEFGNIFAFLGITLVVAILLKCKRYIALLLGNLGLVVILNQFLKVLFVRPRPLHLALIKETGYSFPSGHAMASVAFYGFLIYILWKTNKERSVKIVVTTFLSILVLLIGISRIYLGVHYASDILAGFSLSVIYLIVATRFSAKYL